MTIIDINEQFAALRPGGKANTRYLDIFDAVPNLFTEQTQTTATLKKLNEKELSKGFEVVESETVLSEFDGKVYDNRDAGALGVYYVEFNTVKTELFWIVPPVGIEILSVSSEIEPNTTETISYFASPDVANVKIEYLRFGVWTEIATVANTGTYNWSIPYDVYGASKIRVSDASDASLYDEVNVNFVRDEFVITSEAENIDFTFSAPATKTIYVDWGDGNYETYVFPSGVNPPVNFTHTYTDSLSKHRIGLFGEISTIVGVRINDNEVTKIEYTDLLTSLKSFEIQDNSISELPTFAGVTINNHFFIDNNNFTGEFNATALGLSFDGADFVFSNSGFTSIKGFTAGDNFRFTCNSDDNVTEIDFENAYLTYGATYVLKIISCDNLIDIKNLSGDFTLNQNALEIKRNAALTKIQFIDVLIFTQIRGDSILLNTILIEIEIVNSYVGGWGTQRNYGISTYDDLSKIEADGCDIELRAHNWTAAEVNGNLQIMADNTNILNSDIRIEFQNAAADTTSGGINGHAAIDTLRARGNTVTEQGGY